jgi:hypothetical protein
MLDGGDADRARRRRTYSILVVATALAAALGSAQVALASPAGPNGSGPGWRPVLHVNQDFAGLNTVVAPSGRNVWALGSIAKRSFHGPISPTAFHWNGHRWSRVSSASFPQAVRKTGIACAGASSPSNVWAFAGATMFAGSADQAGALRLVHGHWKLVKSFQPGLISSCLVLSPTQVWVFGDAHVAPGTGTWHLSGTKWTHLPFSNFIIANASAISATDIWAEGENSFTFPGVEHWNGHQWIRNVKLTAVLPKDSSSMVVNFDGIAALSDHDVLFRVTEENCECGKPKFRKIVVLRWNGQSWNKVKRSDPDFYLPGAVPDGQAGWWSVSDQSPAALLHLVHGRWVRVPVKIAACPGLPDFLTDVPGTTATVALQRCLATKPPFLQYVLLNGRLP